MKSFTELYPNNKKFRLSDEYKTGYKTEIIFDRYNQPRIISEEKIIKKFFLPTRKYSEYLREKRYEEYKTEIKLLKHRLSIEYNDIDYYRLMYLIKEYYK